MERPDGRRLLTWYLAIAAAWWPAQHLFFRWIVQMFPGNERWLPLKSGAHALLWPASAPVAVFIFLASRRHGRPGADNNRENGRVG